MNIQNYSCAYDLCKLSSFAMKIELFRRIVRTKSYECVARSKIKIEELESPGTRNRKLKQREIGEFNPAFLAENE